MAVVHETGTQDRALTGAGPKRMKAIVQDRYGPLDEVLELVDVATPTIGDGDVLVRVHAASVGAWVWHVVYGEPYIMRAVSGFRRPRARIPGGDLAGTVVAVGSDVTQLRAGDEVFGEAERAFAEYVAAPANRFVAKPRNLSFEQAAAVPVAANTALIGLRDHGRVGPGDKVLIIGAAGGVGSFAVQLAKVFGGEVTAVCSTRGVELVHSLGADHVVDYTVEDPLDTDERYDVIFQLAGTASARQLRRMLAPDGRLVLSNGEGGGLFGGSGRILRAVLQSPFVGHSIHVYEAKPDAENLAYLRQLIEAGVVIPVIDKVYPFRKAHDAIRCLRDGHARGKIVVTVAPR